MDFIRRQPDELGVRRCVAVAVAVAVVVAALMLSACGSDVSELAALPESETGARYFGCLRKVPMSKRAPPPYSRRDLLSAVDGPGAAVVWRRARDIGMSLGPGVGVPTTIRTQTLVKASSRGHLQVRMATHTARAATIDGQLRCGRYRRDVVSQGLGHTWSSRTTPQAHVRLLPGVVMAGADADFLERVAARLVADSASGLDEATAGILRSRGRVAGGQMLWRSCANGRWAEQTADRRVLVHYILSTRGRAAGVSAPTNSAVISAKRDRSELRVLLRTSNPVATVLSVSGVHAEGLATWDLSC